MILYDSRAGYQMEPHITHISILLKVKDHSNTSDQVWRQGDWAIVSRVGFVPFLVSIRLESPKTEQYWLWRMSAIILGG